MSRVESRRLGGRWHAPASREYQEWCWRPGSVRRHRVAGRCPGHAPASAGPRPAAPGSPWGWDPAFCAAYRPGLRPKPGRPRPGSNKRPLVHPRQRHRCERLRFADCSRLAGPAIRPAGRCHCKNRRGHASRSGAPARQGSRLPRAWGAHQALEALAARGLVQHRQEMLVGVRPRVIIYRHGVIRYS